MVITNIIETSMIGLGLCLALYTIVSDRINDLQEDRKNKYSKLKNKEKDAIARLVKGEKNKESKKEIQDVWKQLNEITSGAGYHYNMGFFVSGIFFIASILAVFIADYIINLVSDKIISPIYFYAQISLVLGLLNFFYIWFRIMLDMRGLFRYKMEIIEESEKKK